jgi:hypothetical protein
LDPYPLPNASSCRQDFHFLQRLWNQLLSNDA